MSNAIDRLEELEGRATGGRIEAEEDGTLSVEGAPVARVLQPEDFPCLDEEDEPQAQAEADALASLLAALRNASKPLLAVVRAGEEVARLETLYAHEGNAVERGIIGRELGEAHDSLRRKLRTLKETTL